MHNSDEMKIYVMRHGETTGNKEGRLQGWLDNPLNEYGIKLAELTGEGMREAGITFDAVFSSSLSRAYETARIIIEKTGSDAEIQVDDRIKEINMGDWEGKKFRPGESEIDTEESKKFFRNPLKASGFPGGEGVRAVMERTQEFLREVAAKDYRSVLVSCHGCSLRSMLNFLYDDPDDFWHGRVPVNCAVSILKVADGNIRLVENDKVFYDESLVIDRYVKF